MDSNLKRTIILENYQNPFHKGLIDENGYIKVTANSDSCIDEIHLMVKIEDNKIIDAYFDGEACAICTSSTSLMIENIIGKTIEEAKEIYTDFYNMIDEKEYNEDNLNSLNAYSDIAKQPNRKRCAILPWLGLNDVFEKNQK